MSIDEILVKIIKISNHLIYRDFGLYGRKGSDGRSLVRLVAYLLGYNLKEVK